VGSFLISVAAIYALPVAANTLFQWLVQRKRIDGWSNLNRGLINAACFCPFNVAYLGFVLESGPIYFLLVILEVAGAWILCFRYAPCSYNPECNKTESVYYLSSHLAFDFVPHLWLVFFIAAPLSKFQCARHTKLGKTLVGDLGDPSYYSRLDEGEIVWALKQDNDLKIDSRHKTSKSLKKMPLQKVRASALSSPGRFKTTASELRKSSHRSPHEDEPGTFKYWTSSKSSDEPAELDIKVLGSEKIIETDFRVSQDMSLRTLRFWERSTRSIRSTFVLNLFLYAVFLSLFGAIKLVSGTTVWHFSEDDIEKNIYKIYISILVICVVGKFGAKRLARLVDRSGSVKYASAELLMEIMFDISYSVLFRFLFPVLTKTITFVELKLLHSSGDVMQNLIRMSETYFVWSSWFQETKLFKYFGIPSDTSSRKEWNARVGLDATIRVIISVVVGLQILTMDWLIFPAMFGWTIGENVEYFNAASVLIELIIYFGCTALMAKSRGMFLNPFKVLNAINDSSTQYVIFVVLYLQYVTCYFGVPKEVIQQ